MANPLMSMLGKVTSGSASGNPMMGTLLNMLMGGKINPDTIIQQLMNSNPQAKQVMEQVNQMTSGKSESDIQNMVKELANKNGIDEGTLNQIISKFK